MRAMAEHLQQLADKFRARANLPPREAKQGKPDAASKLVDAGGGVYRVITLEGVSDAIGPNA